MTTITEHLRVVREALEFSGVSGAMEALDRLRAAHEEQAREVVRLKNVLAGMYDLIDTNKATYSDILKIIVKALSPHAKERKS